MGIRTPIAVKDIGIIGMCNDFVSIFVSVVSCTVSSSSQSLPTDGSVDALYNTPSLMIGCVGSLVSNNAATAATKQTSNNVADVIDSVNSIVTVTTNRYAIFPSTICNCSKSIFSSNIRCNFDCMVSKECEVDDPVALVLL